MKKVLISSGPSSNGKSSFARQFCAEHSNYPRVNRADSVGKAVLRSLALLPEWPLKTTPGR